MIKRVILFLLTNILIMVTIGIVLQLTGLNHMVRSETGFNLGALLAFCAVIGFSGAFIALAISRIMAKWMMGVQVIDSQTAKNDSEQWLIQTVHRYAKKAQLPAMPQVGIYDAPEVNAFATGPTRARSLVAVSTGLLNSLDKKSVEGVIGHEIAHIANGDMVTMTLLQGVVNTFVEFFSRIVGWAAAKAITKDDHPSPWVYYLFYFLFQIIFAILGTMVVMAFSRYREFHADRGGAQLAGRDSMISALEGLKRVTQPVDTQHAALNTFKINGKKNSFLKLFASHPDLDERISRLRQAQIL